MVPGIPARHGGRDAQSGREERRAGRRGPFWPTEWAVSKQKNIKEQHFSGFTIPPFIMEVDNGPLKDKGVFLDIVQCAVDRCGQSWIPSETQLLFPTTTYNNLWLVLSYLRHQPSVVAKIDQRSGEMVVLSPADQIKTIEGCAAGRSCGSAQHSWPALPTHVAKQAGSHQLCGWAAKLRAEWTETGAIQEVTSNLIVSQWLENKRCL